MYKKHVGENLQDLWLGKEFFRFDTKKPCPQNGKIDKLNLIKHFALWKAL